MCVPLARSPISAPLGCVRLVCADDDMAAGFYTVPRALLHRTTWYAGGGELGRARGGVEGVSELQP